ncbi:hypothetical protein C0993_006366 [Termitomyces sp. T159_Od127]|nr:hypothetical protein C0993_006366 [Termitomyces sp. T159_Od127]
MPLASTAPTVAKLVRWCTENDIWIDPRLVIRIDEAIGIAVYAEDKPIPAKTSSSRWFGYLQALPSKPLPIPLFWAQEFFNTDPINDGKEGLQWLEGTEIGRRFTTDSGVTLEDITEFNVCSQCGSLRECPHDADEAIDQSMCYTGKIHSMHSNALQEHDSYYEMVSNVEIMPGEEIYNTYGSDLTNAQLLTRYGFTLDVNDNDYIHWDLNEVLLFCIDLSGALHSDLSLIEAQWVAVVHSIGRNGIYTRLSESSLIYFHQGNENSVFSLDSDGRVSHNLWALLALPLCMRRSRSSAEEQISLAAADLEGLLEYQLTIEGANTIENIHQQPESSERDAMLAAVARSIINLCSARKSQLGKKLLPRSSDLNEILDVGALYLCKFLHLFHALLSQELADEHAVDQGGNNTRDRRTVHPGQLYINMEGLIIRTLISGNAYPRHL